MSGKPKTRSVLLIVAIAAILLGGFFVLQYFWVSAEKPGTPPPELIDTDKDGTPDTYVSFSMFQALRVAFTDGTDSWKYPSSRTALAPLTIIDKDTSKTVSSLQAYIFFNLISGKTANSVTFTCDSKLSLYDANKQLVKDFSDWTPISYVVNNPQNGTDTYVISATISAADFQRLVVPSGVQLDETYYYVFSCQNIKAAISFSDGTSANLGATGVQAETNQLWWKFRVTQSGNVMQIVHQSVEWSWK